MPTPTVDKATALALAKALGGNESQVAQVGAAFKEPTIAETYKNVKAPVADPEAARAIDTGINMYSGVATAPVNEDEIRNKTLNQFQAEIDASNQIYADKLREAKVQGLSRLGSGRATAARSGLLGSDFGNAQNDKIAADNAAIENSILAEKQAKIAEIMGKASTAASGEIAAKRKAQQEGLDAYLKFLGAKTERKSANLKAVAASLIDQDIKPEELDPARLKELATSYGVTTDEIISTYTTDKKASDEAKKKAAAAAQKEGSFDLAQGGRRYVLQADGTYKILENPKDPSTTVKNPITITEAQRLGLPMSIVGQSQDTILPSFESAIAPAWFKEKADKEANASLLPDVLSKLWNEYRTKIKENFEAGDGALY